MAQPREDLAKALQNWLTPEQLSTLVDEVLQMKKKMHVMFTCRKCGMNQYQYGEAPDAKAVSSALTELLTQAYGRAGEEAHQGAPIQLLRYSITDLDTPAVPDPKPKSNMTGRKRKTVGRQKPATEPT